MISRGLARDGTHIVEIKRTVLIPDNLKIQS